ncbi:MAG: copper chaperone [Petroclostridium sp.]|jgi:copper chaperone|uniref:heavy-metal-associated domain-containing protein n=1 Tax=Petroclostridium xylanilyticum TaxID=1792311 RepID=UPI000B999B42|nr:copper ion binding protein [Petroclostridium xylanilyticum]MBZ4644856.1 copper resistance protein CopZ [Clostridia bacterium]MDK2809563.1 copper chaperone [Petroclostridium sp.]
MNSAVFNVEGMNCSNCVDIIRSSVGAIKGVQNVKIDFDSKQVKVDYDSSVVQEQKIKDTITEMGYGLK